MKNFFTGAELREIRENMALTLSELAEKSGVSKSSIGNFETGARGLGKKARHAIEAALSANRENADSQTPQQKSDDSTAPPPRSTEQRNLPAKQAPSEEALKLLGMLYDLDRTALPIHNRAHLENDKPNMAVASVVLNFISLVRSCESDMAALGKVATIVYQVHLSMDGDQSQIRMLKTILDSLCQIP